MPKHSRQQTREQLKALHTVLRHEQSAQNTRNTLSFTFGENSELCVDISDVTCAISYTRISAVAVRAHRTACNMHDFACSSTIS